MLKRTNEHEFLILYIYTFSFNPAHTQTHSLTALKIFLGIVLLGKACQYRATPPSSPDQVRKSSSTSEVIGSETLRHRRTKSSTSSVDLMETVSEPTFRGMPKASVKPKMKTKSLSEIERFTLCSNRIV